MNDRLKGAFRKFPWHWIIFGVLGATALSPPEGAIAAAVANGGDSPLTLFRVFEVPDTYGVARAARGTHHCTCGKGCLILEIPGEPLAAYLYVAGRDYPGPGRHFPGGDERVKVVVTSASGATTYTHVPVVHHGGSSFLNRLDISGAVAEGENRIAISCYNLNRPEGLFAIAVFRNALPGVPLTTIQLLDGADKGYFPRSPPGGPDSELVTFSFAPVRCADRSANVLLGLGGLERARGDEVFVFTGTGEPGSLLPDSDGDNLPDIVDRTHRIRRIDRGLLGNDPVDRLGHLEAVPGAVSLEEDLLGVKRGGYCCGDEVDLFSEPFTIPAGADFAAFQVQSEDAEFGDSFTVYLGVAEIPHHDCPVPEIEVVKEVEPTVLPEPGGEALFTVTVRIPAAPGTLREDVDLETLLDDRFGDITLVQGRIRDTTCVARRRIPLGDFYRCTFRAEVSGTATAPHRNWVTAAGRGAESGEPVSDSDDAVVTFFTVPALGAIGDYVWEDADRDGEQDAGEAGIPGVTVQLRNGASGDLLATDLTDAEGIYGFADLPAGQYRVTVVPPPCMVRTWDLDGIGSPDTAALALGPAEARLDVDFGYALPRPGIALAKSVSPAEAYPGDVVTYGFEISNTGEAQLHNVVVTDPVLNPTPPHVVASLADLAPGATVRIQVGGFTVPGCGDSRTLPGPCADGACALLPAVSGADVLFPSCIPPAICRLPNTATVTAFHCAGMPVAASDGACLTILPLKRVGDLVWHDADGDGVRDAGEPGIAGVTVTLRRPDGRTVTVGTDGTGGYSFWELRDGEYTVTPAAPATAPVLTTPPSPRAVSLGKCQIEDLSADFGFREAPAP